MMILPNEIHAITFYPKGFGIDIQTEYDSFSIANEDCEILQSTGLKDKMGAEIFEADLIKVKEIIWLIEPIGSLERDGNYYGLCVSRFGNGLNYLIDKSILKGEVIGDIYTTPALLEGEKGK
jgi:uncharacterized phage protein (TIGR01671 family)